MDNLMRPTSKFSLDKTLHPDNQLSPLSPLLSLIPHSTCRLRSILNLQYNMRVLNLHH